MQSTSGMNLVDCLTDLCSVTEPCKKLFKANSRAAHLILALQDSIKKTPFQLALSDA